MGDGSQNCETNAPKQNASHDEEGWIAREACGHTHRREEGSVCVCVCVCATDSLTVFGGRPRE